MLSISIQKQEKRPPFLKLCLADGWAGGQAQTSQTKICEMLLISIEKQRKRLPFLKLCVEDGWAGGAAGEGARLARRNALD